jgi:RNA polymerase sigma-70 factor (ECF subfamily)
MKVPVPEGILGQTSSPDWFATTHWSVILQAVAPDSPQAKQALEKLCRAYWLPLYTYIRRQGYAPHDAQDLTQGFFVRLLRTDSFAAVAPDKGKFRTFLLVALRHFLSDERDRERAGKRGGGQAIISIDENDAEQRYLQMPVVDPEPEKSFDRRWALSLLEAAMGRLQREYHGSGRAELFEVLKGYLSSEARPGKYDALAPRLGMSANALGVAVRRLRQRYRECIRFELAETVASLQELDQEMNYLFTLLTTS